MFRGNATVEGVHKRLPDCHPIGSVHDSHFMWLNLNHGWRHARKQQGVTVPNDCFNYHHLAHHQMQYIITGKISTKPVDRYVYSLVPKVLYRFNGRA